jgi:hypothetical protein
MSSGIQFRIACEECHERKIRCKQANKDSVGTGSCQACHANSRKCLFSLKSKTGRPKTSQSSSGSSIPTLPVSPPPAPLSVSNLSSSVDSPPRMISSLSRDQTTRSSHEIPKDAQMQFNFNINQGQIQTISEFLSEQNGQSHFPPDMNNRHVWQRNGEYEGGSGSLKSVFHVDQHFLHPSGSSSVVAPMEIMKNSPHYGSANPFVNHFKEITSRMSARGQDNTAVPNQVGTSTQWNRDRPSSGNIDIGKKTKQSQIEQQSEASTDLAKSKFLRALEFTHELRWYCEPIHGRSLSLLAAKDAEDVRILLESLDKLCTKISAMIPTALELLSSQEDLSTYILVFAAVMEVIDQTIRRLDYIVELDARFDPGLSMPDSKLCADFDMDLFSLAYSSTQNSTSSPPHNFDPDSVTGTMEAELVMSPPEIEIEHLLSLTRLDYYLLRFKSFISDLDFSPDILGATTFKFSSSSSMARLLSFHRCIEGIQSGWKTRWCK